ncbi:MAG: hypothetical protein AAF721_14555 [Myxococcota bacterium]
MKRRIGLGVGLLVLASTVGCGDIDPRAGIWFIDNDGVIEDTCKVSAVQLTSGEFKVFRAEDGDLIIDPQDGTEPFKCTIDGDAFECPNRLSQTISVGSFDAEVDVHAHVDGAFDSDESASGVRHAELSCRGDDCDSLAASFSTSLPCEMSVSFTADYLRD